MNDLTPPTPRVYTVSVAVELAERFMDWTRISEVGADWVKIVPGEDGSAEVWLSAGAEPPKDPDAR